MVLVIAGFIVVMMRRSTGSPGSAWLSSACALGYVAVAYGLTRLTVSLGMRQMMGVRPSRWWMGRVTALLAMGTQAYLVLGLMVVMWSGWGGVIDHTFRLERVPLLGTVLAAAPFVAALVLHWWAMAPLDLAMRARMGRDQALSGRPMLPCWSRRQYVTFQIRTSLLFLAVPVAAIVLLLDCLVLAEQARWISAQVSFGAGMVALAGVFLVAPMMIVRVWRAKPLPPGPLRSGLEETCRRLKIGYRDILIWRTGGTVANAGVMGMVAPMRYILLSDALLDNLDDEHVRAIFAHETGHVVHRHIRYMVLFALAAVALLLAVVAMAGRWLGVEELSFPAQAGVVLVLGAAWLLAFGMLSRRFERQADVFAAASVSAAGEDDPSRLSPHGAEVFSDALLEVARLNAIPLDRRNFRHGTIRSRVRFLSEMVIRGVAPAGVDRRIRCIKVGICALAAAGVILAAVLYDRDGQEAQGARRPPSPRLRTAGEAPVGGEG